MANEKLVVDSGARLYSRPADQSVEAYRAFVMGLYMRITGRTDDDATPEEWEAACKKFWAKGNDEEEK